MTLPSCIIEESGSTPRLGRGVSRKSRASLAREKHSCLTPCYLAGLSSAYSCPTNRSVVPCTGGTLASNSDVG